MSRSAPALAPLFRSDQQMRILAVLFADADEALSIGEVARRADVAQATASREVARLAEHGLQRRMEVRDGLQALLPAEVRMHRVALDGARPDDRALHHQVVHALGP